MPALTDPWIPSTSSYVAPFSTVKVYRVTGTGSSMSFQELPNVQCLVVEEHEGAAPSSALFRYVFDNNNSRAPQSIEQALSTSVSLPLAVNVGDRLAVSATKPDGSYEWLFDGFPLAWGCHVAEKVEVVTMQATGIAKRLWDTPIGGAICRNADQPKTGLDVVTDLVAQFNPRGKPNATPANADANAGGSGTSDISYPTFLDPYVTLKDPSNGDKPYQRTWDIAMAARHLIFANNDGTYVTNPKGSDLDALLVSREPNGSGTYDPTDSSTYTAKPIPAADTPISGRNLVPTLQHLIGDYGFGINFPLTTDSNGNPTTALKPFLKQAGTPKSIYLPARGSNFDPTLCNMAEGSFSRDLAGAVNQWTIEGALNRHEVSLVLAPGFPAQGSDVTTLGKFSTTATEFDASSNDTHNAYRLWIFDETGENHYPNGSATASTTIPSLDDIFGAPMGGGGGGPGTPQYVHRRRPPIGTLLAKDGTGQRMRYKLSISTDYAGTYPAVWDGTGTWQEVHGGYELLKDRLGIWVNCQNPNAWKIGKKTEGTGPLSSGVVKAVECMAAASTANPAFFLRLTCVVEADKRLSYTAAKGATSPLTQTIEQRIDAHDRLRVEIQAKCSEYNTTGSDQKLRDDTDLATAEALATRIATECGVFDGDPVEIPYLTRYYDIGDRIDQINGRGLGFRTDTGTGSTGAVLPVVVKRRFELLNGQRTTLWLSDAGLDRRNFKRKGVRKPVAAKAAAPAPAVPMPRGTSKRDWEKTENDPRYNA
ncbi:MAG: hypothetical protein P4L84_34970 [Isosphaeraceae bacterium]|nr:hypothetical protein [Isosphaeraceae bacterium]